MLDRLLDPEEFLSGLRHSQPVEVPRAAPFVFGNSEVRYDPAESDNKIKGGNSNWRGPIWFPTTFLIIDSLRTLGQGYGARACKAPRRSRTIPAG